MTNKLTKPGRKIAIRMFFVQLSVLAVCVIACFGYWGLFSARSAFVGGLIGVIPQCFFAYKAFKYAGGSKAKQVVQSFYSGEKIKLVLTAFLMAATFRFIEIDAVPFFTSFSLVVVLPLLTPVFLNFNHWDK